MRAIVLDKIVTISPYRKVYCWDWRTTSRKIKKGIWPFRKTIEIQAGFKKSYDDTFYEELPSHVYLDPADGNVYYKPHIEFRDVNNRIHTQYYKNADAMDKAYQSALGNVDSIQIKPV